MRRTALWLLFLTLGGLARAGEALPGFEELPARRAGPARELRAPYLPLKLDGRELEATRVHGESIDFRLGRDNLAFVNPSGVMRLGGMAGNCYTMAFVAKLLFEDARYEPGSPKAGVSCAELASHLAGGRRGKLVIRGYESLFDLTRDPDAESAEPLEARIHAAMRARNGLAAEGPGPGERMETLVEMSHFITSVHYMFYVQRTGQEFLRSTLAGQLSPQAGPRSITREQAESLKASLRGGKTAILLLWNNSVFFGHVILAYGCVETAEADYFVCYDNNEQYGGETRPCILRVSRSGDSIRRYVREQDGSLTGSGGEACEVVMHLPDLTIERAHLADLQKIVRNAGSESAFLMAGAGLLSDLTERSPETSSLFEDIRRFVRNLQAIQEKMGLRGIAPEDRIGANASVEEVNRLLEKYAELGARTAAPYGLPPGVLIDGTQVRFRDERTAQVTGTIRVAPGTTARELALALEKGAAIADPALARWLGSVRDTVGEEPIRADVAFELSKGAGARSAFSVLAASRAPYGPVVGLRRAHVVVGEMEPTADAPGTVVVEVSERVADKAVRSVLDRARVTGPWHAIDADTHLRVNSVRLEVKDGLYLSSDVELFRAVVSAERGVRFHAPAMKAKLRLSRMESDAAGAWRFQLAFGGRFSKHDGVGGLANALVGAYLGWNPDAHLGQPMRAGIFQAQDRLNALLRDELARWVDVVQPLDMARGGYAHFDWTRGVARGFTPTHPQGGAGELVLGLDKLEARLPGHSSPLRIRNIRLGNGRLLLSAEPRTEHGRAD